MSPMTSPEPVSPRKPMWCSQLTHPFDSVEARLPVQDVMRPDFFSEREALHADVMGSGQYTAELNEEEEG